MPGRCVAALALLICCALPAGALAQKCQKENSQLPKPVLAGEVEDAARGIRFEWSSWTYGNGGPWSIVNSMCNTGPTKLILSWPKASLFTTAYLPLPPGESIHNSFTVQTEPNPEDAPITYGLGPLGARAEIYNSKAADGPLNRLRSEISAPVGFSPDGAVLSTVALQFESTLGSDGNASLAIRNKGGLNEISIAISSRNNSGLERGFNRAGIKTRTANFKELLLSNPEQKEILEREYVVTERLFGVREILIPIESSQSAGMGIELAKLAILDRSDRPVMFANISLLFGR